eukprot:359579-Chlamydomonas_euryale.AAC.1
MPARVDSTWSQLPRQLFALPWVSCIDSSSSCLGWPLEVVIGRCIVIGRVQECSKTLVALGIHAMEGCSTPCQHMANVPNSDAWQTC